MGVDKRFLLAVAILYVPMAWYGTASYVPNSDEFIYMLMGREMAAGSIPYADFFSAHMPLMLAPAAASQLLLGVGIWQAKAAPLSFSFLLIIATYLAAERLKSGSGPLAAALLYFSPYFHIYSHAYYGLMLPALLLTGSYLCYVRGHMRLAGFLAALSPFARLNALPAAVALAFFARSERDFFRGAAYASPMLLFAIVPGFLEGTFLYHLAKPAMPFDFRIAQLWRFAASQWLPLLLFAYALWQRVKATSLLAMIGAFYAFHLLSFSVFAFYLFIGLPLVCIYAASARAPKKAVAILAVLWLATGSASIIDSYTVRQDEPFLKVVKGRSAGGHMTCFSRRCPYLHLMSGLSVDGALIDLSDPRIIQQPQMMGAALEASLSGDNDMAFIDLKEINIHQRKSGVPFKGTLDTLFDRYFPAVYDNRWELAPEVGKNFWSDVNHPIVFVPKDGISVGDPIQKSKESGPRHYSERYVFLEGTDPKRMDFTSRVEGPMAELNVPPYLMGENPLNMTVLSPEAIKWPLVPGTQTFIAAGDVGYHVWVSPDAEKTANVFIIAVNDEHILSFTQATYDTELGSFTRVKVFSKLSKRLLTGYVPTYTQVLIAEADYERLSAKF